MSTAYAEIVDFIAGGPTVESVADFEASAATKAKVAELIARAKQGDLTPDERSELDHYMQLEHIMRLAKARARSRSKP